MTPKDRETFFYIDQKLKRESHPNHTDRTAEVIIALNFSLLILRLPSFFRSFSMTIDF